MRGTLSIIYCCLYLRIRRSFRLGEGDAHHRAEGGDGCAHEERGADGEIVKEQTAEAPGKDRAERRRGKGDGLPLGRVLRGNVKVGVADGGGGDEPEGDALQQARRVKPGNACGEGEGQCLDHEADGRDAHTRRGAYAAGYAVKQQHGGQLHKGHEAHDAPHVRRVAPDGAHDVDEKRDDEVLRDEKYAHAQHHQREASVGAEKAEERGRAVTAARGSGRVGRGCAAAKPDGKHKQKRQLAQHARARGHGERGGGVGLQKSADEGRAEGVKQRADGARRAEADAAAFGLKLKAELVDEAAPGVDKGKIQTIPHRDKARVHGHEDKGRLNDELPRNEHGERREKPGAPVRIGD